MAAGTEGLTIMSDMAKKIFTSQSMYLIIIAFSVVITAVYVIRKLSIKFGVNDVFSMAAIIVGDIVSLLLGVLLCFMVHNVDYTQTEHAQFEDDDYYYYVKAVPKLKLEAKGRKKRRR